MYHVVMMQLGFREQIIRDHCLGVINERGFVGVAFTWNATLGVVIKLPVEALFWNRGDRTATFHQHVPELIYVLRTRKAAGHPHNGYWNAARVIAHPLSALSEVVNLTQVFHIIRSRCFAGGHHVLDEFWNRCLTR